MDKSEPPPIPSVPVGSQQPVHSSPGPPPLPGNVPPFEVDMTSQTVVSGGHLVLPFRCLKTNSDGPDLVRVISTIYYVPSWIYVTLVFGVLPYLVLNLALRKGCVIEYSVSRKEKAKVTNKSALSILGFLGSLFLLFYGAVLSESFKFWYVIVIASLLGVIGFLIWYSRISPIRVAECTENQFRTRGYSPDFLAAVDRGGVG